MAKKKDAPDRTMCGILALVLGAWGVHKFMLGQTNAGIIQIVVTLFTCGAGGIIGPIEGIIYLTKSDEQFYQEYVLQRKEWF